MTNPLKIGMIGLDTSHVTAFAKILNNPDEPYHIPGAKIVTGFPGASNDFELSYGRVEGFTKQLRDEFGVDIADSPEAVAEHADVVFITSVDGRKHREFFERTVRFGRPTFIDKPLAVSVADAKAILDKAQEAKVPVMSSSTFRFSASLRSALASDAGAVLGCDAFGPMDLQPTQPGLFWYGIHTVEMIVTAMGVGCRRVQVLSNTDTDLVTAEWNDGRVASIRGLRNAHYEFAITLHREKGFTLVNLSAEERPKYVGLLEAILRSLPHGRSEVPTEETLEVIRIIEAANQSRETGHAVELI